MDFKSCNIIYGYKKHIYDKYLESPNDIVILIEPRTDIIDKLKKEKIPKNIILITRMLSDSDKQTESILYYNKEKEKYFTNNYSLTVIGTNYFNVKKYNVFTTSINNIIIQHNIQNISFLYININIQNCNNILEYLSPFNHIISNIIIDQDVSFFLTDCKILNNFYNKNNLTFTHKNLHLKLPNIGMYFNSKIKNDKEISLLLQQYKMNIIIAKKDLDIVPFPDSIKIFSNIVVNQFSKIYHENIIEYLRCFFQKNENKENSVNVSDLDIIIQFNPKYFDSNKTLQIMYPLKDNIIYVNKIYDIIYATKNCFYMLYQILESKHFTDFVDSKKNDKPKLYKFFSKNYFFEYISKIFIIKEF